MPGPRPGSGEQRFLRSGSCKLPLTARPRRSPALSVPGVLERQVGGSSLLPGREIRSRRENINCRRMVSLPVVPLQADRRPRNADRHGTWGVSLDMRFAAISRPIANACLPDRADVSRSGDFNSRGLMG